MRAFLKDEVVQLATAFILIGLAIARLLLPEFALRADATFFAILAVGLTLLLFPLKSIKSLKAGGFELSLDTPPVQGAVASLSLDRIEDAKLRSRLSALSYLLPVVNGSRVLWIDDRPEKIIGERRLLRALGVNVIPAISSDESRKILIADNDFDLIVTDVQRPGETYKAVGGERVHEGVNFIVWMRAQHPDTIVRELPVLFYAAYDWPRLVEFTRPARETSPEPGISNSVADFVPKVLIGLATIREAPIRTPRMKTPTDIGFGPG